WRSNELRCNRHGLRVIARRMSHDSLCELILWNRQDKIRSAADLKRAAFLKVFALEKRLDAGFSIETRRRHHRSPFRDRPDALRRRLYVFEGNFSTRHVYPPRFVAAHLCETARNFQQRIARLAHANPANY